MAAWEEVTVAKKENRHELVLTGPQISKRIEEKELDKDIFSILSLNFLEISKTCLKGVPDAIGDLKNLTVLALHNNNLSEVPLSVDHLLKLKTLDLSNNKITRFPEIENLTSLESLNVSCNKLEKFPDVNNLVKLHILDLSYNTLEELPGGVCCEELALLSQIIVNDNVLTDLPAGLSDLRSLRVLNVSNNNLTEIPFELGLAPKLKQFSFLGNKLNDKKLLRFGSDCQTKSVLDYLRKSAAKKQEHDKSTAAKEKMKAKKKARKSKGKQETEDGDTQKNKMTILRFKEGLAVRVTKEIADTRPYIVCCIVRNIDFHKTNNMYKRFITLQTKLHDSVCQKRQAGTIATHDLAKVKAPLIYEARSPSNILVVPLFKSKQVSADQLVSKLRQEAEDLRKEKKRSTISGIHKYLDLLKDSTLYACLVDKDGSVISFPPITNCDSTKISADTQELLIEVTSTVSLDTCKQIMQALLSEMLEMGLGADKKSENDSSEDEATGGTDLPNTLTLEQVQILDPEGHMKVVYPSRVDLVSPAFNVQRES